MWETQIYPNSNYPNEFNALDDNDKDRIDSLLEELVMLDEPELYECAVECPHIPNVYGTVKYQCNNVVLIVALERIMEDTDYEVDVINLYSCSA